MAPFEALYRRKCRSPIHWSDMGQRVALGPDVVREAEEKVRLARQRFATAQSRWPPSSPTPRPPKTPSHPSARRLLLHGSRINFLFLPSGGHASPTPKPRLLRCGLPRPTTLPRVSSAPFPPPAQVRHLRPPSPTLSVPGSLYEWRGILIRNYSFLVDLVTLLMALGHYLMIWWLRGMAFHLADAVIVLNLRDLVTAIFKRIKAYIKLRKALSSLKRALPDALYEELCAYNDECAICRGPMARAKKLSCSHLFHLACLRSWLDQGLTEVYSCSTCRRPLFLSAPQRHTGSIAEDAADGQQLAKQFNLGLNQQGIPGHALPVGAFPDQQQNPSDAVWSRGVGLDSGWVPSWSNSGTEGAGSSSAILT
ncbi:E3 ubiquitin protein ligase RIN2-like [Ananas comosus]|uniref:E3 ubiquitin protein ligase RIN2-like n=1 Tax=Ananas comosus TaxID=4615 RepID=A0A6P5F9G6_ANACO|nr:E3 ubiquitin protein ligase RIN2-like [Ananas comosus]